MNAKNLTYSYELQQIVKSYDEYPGCLEGFADARLEVGTVTPLDMVDIGIALGKAVGQHDEDAGVFYSFANGVYTIMLGSDEAEACARMLTRITG